MQTDETLLTEYHLHTTTETLQGASKELITVKNQWAAVGLDQSYDNSQANFTVSIDGTSHQLLLKWDSSFPKDAMKNKHNIAEFGGVSLAFFVMSQLLNYNYLLQTEIGEGVDYWFTKIEELDDTVLEGDGIYVEISGILDGSEADIGRRRKKKHQQINNGSRRNEPAAIFISCLSLAKLEFETHSNENS